MRCGLRLQNHKITKLENPQRGYILIALMLGVALITIALLAVLPAVTQQIKRDREEEMIHRGTAYMRAIQHYYKKLGRYPNRVEDLENTNNMRFLRRRYTDPLNRDPKTGKEKDFKFLHQQDITLNSGPVLGPTAGQLGGGQGGLGQSGFGSGQGAFGSSGGLGGAQNGFGGAGGLSGQSSFGGTQGGFGGSNGQTPGSGTPGTSGSSTSGGTDASGSSNSSASGAAGSSSSSGSGLSGQTFGGGPILGVASLSKDKTIRVFFDKDHYNDWWFIYVPTLDRGGLLTGPVNPNAQASSIGGLNPGQAGLPGQTQGLGGPGQGQGFGGFGQGQGFGGQGQGFGGQGGFNGNNGSSPSPTPAPSTPQQ